jgi:hypothetical protein
MQSHVDFIRGTLELNPGDASPRQFAHDYAADFEILMKLLGVVPLGVPFRFPISHQPQTEADRVDFPTH